MNELTSEISGALATLLADHCSGDAVRAVEGGASWRGLWQPIEAAGFADALCDEAHGGAGLSWADAVEIFVVCGAHALPLPLAETLVLRRVLSSEGWAAPAGPLTWAAGRREGNHLVAEDVACARTADAVWVLCEGRAACLSVAEAESSAAMFVLDARLQWSWADFDAQAVAAPEGLDLRVLQALVAAGQMAGAMGRVLDLTLRYANERQQFGRAIGKFQAIQHQLSVMAEQVAAARMAAQLGGLCDPARPAAWPQRLQVALAKARGAQAAVEVAALAHSIHGAFGFTAEYDLQLFTRRLHQGRRSGGSETLWCEVLGRAVIEGHDGATIGLLRQLHEGRQP